MAINELVREQLPEGCKVFDNHAYDNSIIGVSSADEVIYDFDKMVEEFMADENVSRIEAIEWIEYNTLRAIPYIGSPSPIVMYRLEDTASE